MKKYSIYIIYNRTQEVGYKLKLIINKTLSVLSNDTYKHLQTSYIKQEQNMKRRRNGIQNRELKREGGKGERKSEDVLAKLLTM